MNCDHLREELSGWLDGELDAARSSVLSAHLEVCESCRTTHRAWSDQRARLKSAALRTPPPPAWERLASRLSTGVQLEVGNLKPARDEIRTALATAPVNGAEAVLTRPATERAAVAPDVAAGGTPRRALRLRLGVGLAACAAAAVGLLAVAGLFAIRGGRNVPLAEGTVSPDLVRQLMDAERTPDLSNLGAVTPVSWDRFTKLPRDARFAPAAPAALPGGYVFEEGWVIDSRVCRMFCARYMKDGRVVAVLQSESSGAPLCTLENPQCCLIAGLVCRKSRVDRVEVVQATRGSIVLTVAANAGETDIEAVMAGLNDAAHSDTDRDRTE